MREKSGVRKAEGRRQYAEGRGQFLDRGAPRRRFAPEGTCLYSPPPEGTEPLAPGVGPRYRHACCRRKAHWLRFHSQGTDLRTVPPCTRGDFRGVDAEFRVQIANSWRAELCDAARSSEGRRRRGAGVGSLKTKSGQDVRALRSS